MGYEIERKFLVKGNEWKHNVRGTIYRQGYLSLDPERTVRVRTMDQRGFLTIKDKGTGIQKQEYEYEIPFADAVELLDRLCLQPLIEKKRYIKEYREAVWEIDEFYGENRGLILAEIELERIGQQISIPPWIDKEVSGDPRYFNASLVCNPWCRWKENQPQGG